MEALVERLVREGPLKDTSNAHSPKDPPHPHHHPSLRGHNTNSECTRPTAGGAAAEAHAAGGEEELPAARGRRGGGAACGHGIESVLCIESETSCLEQTKATEALDACVHTQRNESVSIMHASVKACQ
jgi:hypothetical protein